MLQKRWERTAVPVHEAFNACEGPVRSAVVMIVPQAPLAPLSPRRSRSLDRIAQESCRRRFAPVRPLCDCRLTRYGRKFVVRVVLVGPREAGRRRVASRAKWRNFRTRGAGGRARVDAAAEGRVGRPVPSRALRCHRLCHVSGDTEHEIDPRWRMKIFGNDSRKHTGSPLLYCGGVSHDKPEDRRALS